MSLKRTDATAYYAVFSVKPDFMLTTKQYHGRIFKATKSKIEKALVKLSQCIKTLVEVQIQNPFISFIDPFTISQKGKKSKLRADYQIIMKVRPLVF